MIVLRFVSLFFYLSCPLLLFAQMGEPASLPIGITDLLSRMTPAVGFQYFEKSASSLGRGWTGFDENTGVYFVPEEGPEETGQVFIHCPWRGGTGTTFADYRIHLPQTSEVRLAFETSLRASASKSDGVTFRIAAGKEILFTQHCTWRAFRRFEISLSRFAGKMITLRVAVGPGPERVPTEDWFLLRRVRVLAGNEAELARARARADAEAARRRPEAARRRQDAIRRGQELASVDLLPLTSHRNESVCPSVLKPVMVTARMQGRVCVFTCKGDQTLEVRFDPTGGLLAGISVSVAGRPLSPAPFQGGPRVHLDGRDFSIPTRHLKTELVESGLVGPRFKCQYRYTNPETGSAAVLTAVLWAENKSLGLEVRGEKGRFSGFTAKPHGGREIPVAFCVGGNPVWRKEGVYLSTVADLMHSEASSVRRGGVRYVPLTNGKRNVMSDRFYLTVTGRFEEALSNLTHQPSPFLDELAHRVVLDVWSGGFAGDVERLETFARYGIDHLLIIKHVWQRDGYDRTYPNVMPANTGQGGDAELRKLSLTAQKLGHRFCVHENFYDYYPNAEAFKPEDRAVDPKGVPQVGWDRGPIAAAILKSSKLMDYARRFSPEVKKRYDCDAAYHDIMPTWRVDYDGHVKGAGKIRFTHEKTRELCEFDRKLFGGPVVFEAASPQVAGIYDGGCNHGVDTYRTPVSVAYELLKVHPKMSNHGFGYYERWLPWGYSDRWHSYVMTDRELDKFRAYTVAFGRTGFIGQQLMKHLHGVVREYHLMQAFGRAYTGKRAKRLRYWAEGKWIDAGTAARLAEFRALSTDYEGGQQVYVNLDASPMEAEGHRLPPFGMLTLGPRAEAWTAVRQGQICDYAKYDNYVYADARSHVWQPPVALPPIKPSVASAKYLGKNEFELTIHWEVGRKLARNYLVFWHFKHKNKIDFQNDHTPSRPTTSWLPGETVVDGPLRTHVKDDSAVTAYEIVVGLYDKKGRAALMAGADQLLVGRLDVQRNGKEVSGVTFHPVPSALPHGSDPELYLEAANTERKVIDFGEIATNGAVVMHTVPGGRELVPVPLGTIMQVGIKGHITRLEARSTTGPLPMPKLEQHEGKTWFTTAPGAAKYIIGE